MTKYYQDTFRCRECFRLGWIRKIHNQDICINCVKEKSIEDQIQESPSMLQLTLGGLIELLASMPPDEKVVGFKRPRSSRANYWAVEFQPTNKRMRVSILRKKCKQTLYRHLDGYKGGSFRITKNFPVYINIGKLGEWYTDALYGFNPDGTLDSNGWDHINEDRLGIRTTKDILDNV